MILFLYEYIYSLLYKTHNFIIEKFIFSYKYLELEGKNLNPGNTST